MGIYWPVKEDQHEYAVRARFDQPPPDFEADVVIGDADSLILATVTVRFAPKVMLERKMALPGEPVFFFSLMTREPNRKNSERDALAIVFSNRVRAALSPYLRRLVDRNHRGARQGGDFTNEYVDGDSTMQEAFDSIYGPTEDPAGWNGRNSQLWDDAWNLAVEQDYLPLEPWLTLSQLMAGERVLNPGIDPRKISITERTRDEMLVWFDKNSGD